jgi:hypothetical protein
MKKLSLLSMVVASIFSLNAHAGRDGGGGGACVVYGPNKVVRAATLIDLAEGETRLHLHYNRSPIPSRIENPENEKALLKKGAYEILSKFRFDTVRYHDLKESIDEVVSKLDFLPENVKIATPPYDFGKINAIVIPDNCDPQYAAFYEDDGTISVITKIYSKFSLTDRVALVLHEAIYRLDRIIRGIHNSSSSRQLNAYLFGESISKERLDAESKFLLARKTILDSEDRISDQGTATFGHPLSVTVPSGGSGVFTVKLDSEAEDKGTLISYVTFSCDYSWNHSISDLRHDLSSSEQEDQSSKMDFSATAKLESLDKAAVFYNDKCKVITVAISPSLSVDPKSFSYGRLDEKFFSVNVKVFRDNFEILNFMYDNSPDKPAGGSFQSHQEAMEASSHGYVVNDKLESNSQPIISLYPAISLP